MKKVVSVVLFLSLSLILLFPCKVSAKTLQDLYNELAKLQNQYEANKNKKQLTQAQINELNNDNIANINKKISARPFKDLYG